jgi:EAL and modified HD-GYP domain-containing signal transduction protein
MFGFLSRWFGSMKRPAEEVGSASFVRLNEVTPLKPCTSPIGGIEQQEATSYFVCREAVLDRKERIAGYEFSLSRRLKARIIDRSAMVQRAYDEGLLRNLEAAGIGGLLGKRKAFIQLSPASLANPLIERVNPETTIFLFTTTVAESISPESVLEQFAHLRERGLHYGLSLMAADESRIALYAAADFVQVNAAAFDGVDLRALPGRLRALRPAQLPPLVLVASQLQTYDDFQLVFQSGFDYFQGPFVSSRENWHPPTSEINRMRVLELLNLVRRGAEFDVISETLKTEPVLTFKLLRYINSPGMGLQRPATTIAQALLVLGHEKFYRWLSLLLFDIRTPGYRERILTEQALTRGRFMEYISGQGAIPPDADQLFLCGLFSLLDQFMGIPLPEILAKVNLPEPVCAALLGRPSPLQVALRLALATEADDPQAIAVEAAACNLDSVAISEASLRALEWAQQLSASAEG